MGGAIGAIASAKAASKQMAFQKEAYRHRYQWTMQDMQAAGLNPMLAASLGGGQAPPGASVSPGGAGIAGGVATAMDAYRKWKLHGIAVRTADAQAAIAENAKIISDRNTTIGTSAHGISAYKASLLPSGITKQAGYLGDRFGNIWDKLNPYGKPPARVTHPIGRKFQNFKFEKTRRGASGRY